MCLQYSHTFKAFGAQLSFFFLAAFKMLCHLHYEMEKTFAIMQMLAHTQFY